MSESLKNLEDSFYRKFNLNHVILYVGQNAIEENLEEQIASCPWSCIITSRRDSAFSSCFASGDRQPQEICSVDNLTSVVLQRKRPPVLRLFGIEGAESDGLNWLTIGGEDACGDTEVAREMINRIPGLLYGGNHLVMVGIDSEQDWNLVGNGLAKILYTRVPDGSVSIWGIPQEINPEKSRNPQAVRILKRLVKEKSFDVYTTPLSAVIRERKSNDTAIGEEEPPSAGDDIYWKNEAAVNISHDELLRCKNIGTLLTEKTVYKIQPLGRSQQEKWFSTFLETSSILGPQWYGYLPKSTFYVKRSYEEVLVWMVRQRLKGQGPAGGPAKNYPIILTGDPGSSKSITLASLAYRIYTEKEFPVLFISDPSFLSGHFGTEVDELNEVMRLLESKGTGTARTLVIWDSSTYRTGITQAKNLAERLDGMGRRFVLVCSSYALPRQTEYELKDSSFYQFDGKRMSKLKDGSPEEAQLTEQAGAYFIRSTRHMTEAEKFEFWKWIGEYSGIRPETISYLKKKLEDEGFDDIFNYYYLLVSLLRSCLEQQLQTEQSRIYQYVGSELSRIVGQVNADSQRQRQDSAVYQAFLKAGFSPEEIPDLEEVGSQGLMDDLAKRLDRFNICIALFSRFKLEVPYDLAYDILFSDDPDKIEENGKPKNSSEGFSKDDQALFRSITREIPWIYFGETRTGNYAFRFRSAQEASIYLRNHEVTGELQVQLLCRILDIYKKDYRENRYIDVDFTSNLQALLRLMGPNSNYPPFQAVDTEHRNILKHLNELIKKIEELIDGKSNDSIPDTDAGFASIIVTFIREFYGPVWKKLYPVTAKYPWTQDPEHYSPEAYRERLERIGTAIQLAERSIDYLNSQILSSGFMNSMRLHLIQQRFSLIVETGQCNFRLEELFQEYKDYCAQEGSTPDRSLAEGKLSYRFLYNQLWSVISSEPTNGYAYNTLFRLFEQLYEGSSLPKEKKLQYLTEITTQVVENCKTLHSSIINRGTNDRDELEDHITKITDYSADFQITLEAIDRHRKGETPQNEGEKLGFELYDDMLEAQNPSAILFVCQKELQLPRTAQTLNTDQLLRCRRIYEFMMEEDNFSCIGTSAYALAMLIRTCWMLYNETLLNPTRECQITRLSHEKWETLYRLCGRYDRCTDSQGETFGRPIKQPIIMLLYALSALQVNNLTDAGFQEALSILSRISDDFFYQPRMRTPFMICDERGEPIKYSGTVERIEKSGGTIRIHDLHELNRRGGVRFHQRNLGRGEREHFPGDVFGKELELGIGYTSFSVYKVKGRKEKEARQ